MDNWTIQRMMAVITALVITEEEEQLEERMERRRKTRVYIKDKSRGYFAMRYSWLRQHPDEFKRIVRMFPGAYDYLVELLGERIVPKSWNLCMGLKERLFLTLHYLASGTGICIMADMYLWNRNTVRNAIRKTCIALYAVLQPLYMPVPTTDDYRQTELEFWTKYNLPNIVGALDGKHVRIVKPKNSSSLYMNYKNFFSIVLMASCDANCSFNLIDVGAYGSQSDGGVLRNAHFGQRLFDPARPLALPPPKPLPRTAEEIAEEVPEVVVPHMFVGDAAFPLHINILRPYTINNATPEQIAANYRFSRARIQIERSFGILTTQWRVYLSYCHLIPACNGS